MMIYVYKINDRLYGAGLGLEKCQQRGKIVEKWPVNTPDEAKFASRHGTSYYGAAEKVSKLADLMHRLLTEDPTFEPPQEVKTVVIELPEAPKGRLESWWERFRRKIEVSA